MLRAYYVPLYKYYMINSGDANAIMIENLFLDLHWLSHPLLFLRSLQKVHSVGRLFGLYSIPCES